MEAILLLANSAEQSSQPNMVSALGLGWSVTGSPTPPYSLVLFIKVPWDQTNRSHSLDIRLLDADGRPVAQGPDASVVAISGRFEVGRPVGIPQGMAIDQTVTIGLPPMELTSGQVYEWVVDIDSEAATKRPFYVRPESPLA